MNAQAPELPRRSRLGLRSRLALGVALIALLAGVGASLGLSTLALRVAREGQRSRGLALLEALAPASARALATEDLPALDDHLSEALRQVPGRDGRLIALRAYDAQGRLVLEAVPAQADRARAAQVLDGTFLDCAVAGSHACWRRLSLGREEGELLAMSVPAVSGLRWGTLVAVADTSAFELRARGWTRALVSGVAVADILLFLVVWAGVSLAVLSPIARLHAAVEHLQRGELGARVGLRRRDELGQLGAAFDAMAARLQVQTEGLEREIAQRNAQVLRQNEELARMNRHLAGMNLQLERLATTDALTGLSNRRQLEEALDFELVRAQRVAHPFCLLLIDLDHFKQVNDTWGHQRGDEVLVNLAGLLRASLRTTDLQARWGGEEFVVLLLDTAREAGLQAAEKLRASVAALRMRDPQGQALPITVSIGVACFPEDGVEARTLFASADEALYRAKSGGRNRVEAALRDPA